MFSGELASSVFAGHETPAIIPFPPPVFCGTVKTRTDDCLSGIKGKHMGFHPLDIIIIIGIALLLFGPKTLQSISHSAGRGMGHAKEMKDKLMKELPMEELSEVGETFSQIPTSPQQVAHKLIGSSLKPDEKKEETPAASASPDESAGKQE